MRKDKELIFKLRQEGKSYGEIQRETGISRGTLTAWFKNISWSKHLSEEHRKKNRGASKERMERLNMVRKLKLQYQYALIESEAATQYASFKHEPLFWAGLMAYAGAGDKRTKHLLRLSSADCLLHRIFVLFCKKYLGVGDGDFRIALLIDPKASESECREVWERQLPIEQPIFHKTQIIKGNETGKRLQYGVGMSIISSTSLKKKVLKWLSLAEAEMFETAVIV